MFVAFEHQLGEAMRSLLRIIAAVSALSLVLVLAGCVGENKAEDTTADKTTVPDTTVEDTTKADKEPEEITYTLPMSVTMEGNLLKEYSYSQNGLTMTMTDYAEESPITYTVTFDSEGNPLYTEWVIAVNDIRTEKWKDEYTLDDRGNIVTEKRYCEGALQFTYTYTYDENGNMLTKRSQKEYRDKGFTDYVLTYDDHNTCVSVSSSLNGKPFGDYREPIENSYDEKGRVTETRAKSYKMTYEYTEKEGFVTNEKIAFESYNEDGSTWSWNYYNQYTYENGKLVKEDCLYDGILTDTTLYTQSKWAHYARAIDWIFSERLP